MDAIRIVDSLEVKRKRTGRVNGEGREKKARARAEVRRTGRPGRTAGQGAGEQGGRGGGPRGERRAEKRRGMARSFVRDCRQFPQGLVASGSPNKLFRG